MTRKKFLIFLTLLFIAGCGGSVSDSTQEDQAGLSIFRVSAFPTFSGFFNPIVLVENNPGPPTLKTQTTASGGIFCSKFCYLKQGVLEAVRQSEELDFFLCLARKANSFSSKFEIPTAVEGGCGYFEVLSPSLGDGTGAILPEILRFRLCRSGDNVTLHMCGDGILRQELVLANDTSSESVTGTMVKKIAHSTGCEDKSRVTLSANCEPDEFANPDCRASLNGTYCGCYGNGVIHYQVGGGDPNPVVFESDFAAGGLGSANSGDFSFCSLGEWTAGAEGCFKTQSSGGFPAIAASEVPLAQIEGCEDVAGATSVCPNPDFDPNTYDPIYPTCPFAVANGDCTFLFDETGCCDVSGDTLGALAAVEIDSTPVADLFDRISGQSCPGQGDCPALDFEDAWDCQAEAGRTFVAVNLAASGIDFTECSTLLQDVNSFVAEENCSEQGADRSGDKVIADVDALPNCLTDPDCTGGLVCHIIDDGGTPADATDDIGVCVTPPDDCNLLSPSCAADETCAYDPEFDHAKCVPSFECPATSCAANQPCNASSGVCASVTCNYLADDCAARLGTGYTCDPTLGTCK